MCIYIYLFFLTFENETKVGYAAITRYHDNSDSNIIFITSLYYT